ncbi:DNA primase [Enterobacter sp. CGMCC 5087]|uniref:DNA primase n=1 Tax=Enterobacter sp. CGMCC 5087 TaxID=2183878 RepID=UPI000D68123A|nr:DNA primase [Enterobacter sp. CGMCC 5087]PWI82154.1 DNA primase [Enterobacter sp. CGMCC 5087]
MFKFGHLLGGKASRRLEEDNQDDPELEDDKQPQGKTRGRRADDNPDDPNDDPDANDDPEDPDNPDKQGRKAKKSRARRADENSDVDGEDDDGDDNVDDPDDKQARMDERTRCARIFGSPHAAGNTALAASLAFNTGMSSAAAIQVMANTAPPVSAPSSARRMTLDDRMRAETLPKLKQDTRQQGGLNALVSQYQNLSGKRK